LRDIPLVLYGECPENEAGGPVAAQSAASMSRRWLEEFGGLNGLRVSDLVDAGIASRQALFQYTYPTDTWAPHAAFVGHYFPWDGEANAELAREHGFEWALVAPTGNIWKHENLDNAQTGLHDWFRYLKFGYGRATDQVSYRIRRGRITREQGVMAIRKYDGQCPNEYLGVYTEEILRDIGMSLRELIACERRFTNPELFERANGELIRKFEIK
jgi:hypothetical protein